MSFSGKVKKVIGIEINTHAVLDAKRNVEYNKITNMEMIKGDVGKVLEDLKKKDGFIPPTAVIVDPPRKGLESSAIEHLLALKPKYILYISCNPLTQADDIKKIIETDYELQTVQPIDQFPHTPHIENIALLKRI